MILAASRLHSGVALQDVHGSEVVSYPELGRAASELARGLISMGIQPGDRVAILGSTSIAWTLADCGALCAGAVVTPIYHTNSPAECAHVLADSDSRIVFCENAEQIAKVEQVSGQCPALERIVVFAAAGADALTLDDLRRRGQDVAPDVVLERLEQIPPDEVATLVYTSGTSGPPKGCMLTHGNFLSAVHAYVRTLGVDERNSVYQFLPLAHVMARIIQFEALSVGARVVFWTGDPTKVLAEVGQSAPTHFPSVPRIFEKIHGAVVSQLEDGPAPQRRLFDWAVSTGARTRDSLRTRRLPPLLTDLLYRIAQPLALDKVRAMFGPNLQVAFVGAAPVGKDLLEFFDACGVLILEAYGLTETCAAATLNVPDAVRFGTVGKPLPGTEVSLASDGEILLRGPQVFKGYHKRPEATAEALTPEGWFCTGDIGTIDREGFVTITGRKKEIIVTSSGKKIAPLNIESQLRHSPYVDEAVVYAERRPYVVAMLTLDQKEMARLAERLGVPADLTTLAADPRVHAELQRDIDAVNAQFARIEQIKRFAILDHGLSQAAGELTPTLKVKRSVVYDKYAEVFAGLYEEPQR
ncbi:MAG TPA: long-chain fatty acid--CoA ligase [Solirubrobacteraceae bacterium]|nr:long-chain fatty acid--CoA ligase [Solirubrobacteraceae bacterium]